MSITITLAGEPVAKGRPRFAKRGNHMQVYTPAKTLAYESELRDQAKIVMLAEGVKPFTGPVAVEMLAQVEPPASWSMKKQRQARLGEIQPTSRPDLVTVRAA